MILQEVKRVSKTKYSIHMTNEWLGKTWSFTYVDTANQFDLREQGDLELLLLYADEYYRENYLFNFNTPTS